MDIITDFTILVGKRIKEIRKLKKLSQEALGLITGINSADISKYESGKINLTFKTLLRFAVALQVHPRELCNFEFDITLYDSDF